MAAQGQDFVRGIDLLYIIFSCQLIRNRPLAAVKVKQKPALLLFIGDKRSVEIIVPLAELRAIAIISSA